MFLRSKITAQSELEDIIKAMAGHKGTGLKRVNLDLRFTGHLDMGLIKIFCFYPNLLGPLEMSKSAAQRSSALNAFRSSVATQCPGE